MDDLIVIGLSRDQIEEFKRVMTENFEVTDLYLLSSYLELLYNKERLSHILESKGLYEENFGRF